MGMAGVWDGRGGVGGRRVGGTAVTCPVRLGREPSAGGTFLSFFLSLPPAAALSIIFFHSGLLLSRVPHVQVKEGPAPPCSSA